MRKLLGPSLKLVSLSIGLNLSKQGPRQPVKPTQTTTNSNPKPIFGDPDSSDSESALTQPSKSTKPNTKSNPALAAPNFSTQRSQKLIAEQTASIDAAVYDYDSFHTARDAGQKQAKALAASTDSGGGGGSQTSSISTSDEGGTGVFGSSPSA